MKDIVVSIGTSENLYLNVELLADVVSIGMVGIKGSPGSTGAKGDDGEPASVDAGSTTTGAPGTSASVTNVGTTTDAIFNFTIPRGDVGAGGAKGDPGSAMPIATAAGTADAITANYSPDITLSDMILCAFVATGANTTTTPTFAPDGLTAHTITKKGGSALTAGDIPAAFAVCILEYNLANTRWELLNPAVSGVSYASAAEIVTGTEPAKAIAPDQLRASTASAAEITTGTAIKLITADQLKTAGIVAGGGSGNNEKFLTNLLYLAENGGHRDIVRAGWKPAFFNQQWGGSPILGGLDGDLNMDYATGYNEQDTAGLVGYDNTNYYLEQQFLTASSITCAAVWIKLYKVGNPTANFTLSIYSDTGGSPNAAIANGAATVQAGTLHSSDTNGTWYRFEFATPPSLTANTAYHIVMTSSSVSSTNYWKVMGMIAGKYPNGDAQKGSNVPAWSAYASFTDLCFVIEPTSTYRFLQSGGAFNYKLVGCEGTPLDQSYGLTASLKDIGFNPYEFTWKGTFTNLAKSKPFAEFMYGLDHDRISLSIDSNGYAVLRVYEGDATVTTIQGTTDVSSGTFDIGIYVRAKGDGADVATLYINGTADDSHTALTLTFDYVAFRELGTAWLLGGFPVCPAWTKETLMGSLPASDGWTYDGTATEAAHAVVSGGKLYQQIVGSTDTCRWHIHPTFNNANGWAFCWKSKVIKASDVTGEIESYIGISDGAKYIRAILHTYYIEVSYDGGSTYANKVQIDLTKQEHIFTFIGKGSDFYVCCDGKLIVDGTGLMTSADATSPEIYIGDGDATASSNAEVVSDYWKYYETAAILPQFNSGALSEAALWSGNMTSILLPLYNAGTRISVKQYCGVAENYVKWVKQNVKQEGIIGNSVTSTSLALLSEMERFIYGEKFNVEFVSGFYNDTNSQVTNIGISCDGVVDKSSNNSEQQQVAAKDVTATSIGLPTKTFSLHKVEGKMGVGGNTTVVYAARKILTILEVE